MSMLQVDPKVLVSSLSRARMMPETLLANSMDTTGMAEPSKFEKIDMPMQVAAGAAFKVPQAVMEQGSEPVVASVVVAVMA